MNYIVLDLEWNQGDAHRDRQDPVMPFEIIELGAVKLDGNRKVLGEFSKLVRPSRYHTMHYITGKLLHLRMEELSGEADFPAVMRDFLGWCGDTPCFCTWGPSDLTELQRNMKYHGMGSLSDGPLPFFDVQKLYALAQGQPKNRCALETAVEGFALPMEAPFHRALDDARYTAQIFRRLSESVLVNYSYDYFTLPEDRESEVHVRFAGYTKYISRSFPERSVALADEAVMETRCLLCGRPLRKHPVSWFTPNGRHYYNVSECPEHGLMKTKVRIRRAEDGGVYVVRTNRFIEREEMQALKSRAERAEKTGSQKESVRRNRR
ncbi:3'-5' exonuclease [Lachnoclostridium sp. Marseille-P6806]|uniref:3'-5' exonuclease n=1 Tax=Lachnoclostridium sp. Marseille-P6806 TaxID=2364793 RepID=UPI001030D446|nr:3'-5' exonuclease [Lachnoclostridium sp. Marseille-P6806]